MPQWEITQEEIAQLDIFVYIKHQEERKEKKIMYENNKIIKKIWKEKEALQLSLESQSQLSWDKKRKKKIKFMRKYI